MVTCQVRNWKKFYQNILINAETSVKFVTGMYLSCNWILYLYLQYRKISDCQLGIPSKTSDLDRFCVWVECWLQAENIKYLNTVNCSQLLLLILHRLPRQYWAERVKSSLCLNTESLTTDYLNLLRHIGSRSGSDDVISSIQTQIWCPVWPASDSCQYWSLPVTSPLLSCVTL